MNKNDDDDKTVSVIKQVNKMENNYYSMQSLLLRFLFKAIKIKCFASHCWVDRSGKKKKIRKCLMFNESYCFNDTKS